MKSIQKYRIHINTSFLYAKNSVFERFHIRLCSIRFYHKVHRNTHLSRLLYAMFGIVVKLRPWPWFCYETTAVVGYGSGQSSPKFKEVQKYTKVDGKKILPANFFSFHRFLLVAVLSTKSKTKISWADTFRSNRVQAHLYRGQ